MRLIIRQMRCYHVTNSDYVVSTLRVIVSAIGFDLNLKTSSLRLN